VPFFRNSHGDADGYFNPANHAYTNCDSNNNTNAYRYSEPHTYINTNRNTHAASNTYAKGNSDSEGSTYTTPSPVVGVPASNKSMKPL